MTAQLTREALSRDDAGTRMCLLAMITDRLPTSRFAGAGRRAVEAGRENYGGGVDNIDRCHGAAARDLGIQHAEAC